MRSLERLRLASGRPREGVHKGDRASTRRGSSVEFMDFRPYTPGDDPRRIDWPAYARLGRPFVRLFREEEDVAVHLLLDVSASMGFGRHSKFVHAARVTGALGYVALTAGDPVRLSFLSQNRAEPALGGRALRGRRAGYSLFSQLASRSPREGATDLNAALAQYARSSRQTGLALVVSDLMIPDGGREGILSLQARGFQTCVIQVLSAEELSPDLRGDIRLVDVETGESREVTLDTLRLQEYGQRLRGWLTEIRERCVASGIRYALAPSDGELSDQALRTFRAAGILE